MTELFKFLADNGLSLKAEYVDNDLVVVLTKIDIDFYCAFAPGDVKDYSELFMDWLNPSLIALKRKVK